MMAGFVLLGRVTALRPARPWLVLVAGAASIAAGLFRRDHLLLDSPGFAGESWHNQVHDVVSGVAYGAMLAAPLVLARRWRDDPGWTPVSRPVQALALVSAGVLAVFASRIAGPCNGIVQRVRGHACAGRRDPHRPADANPAGTPVPLPGPRRHTRPGSAGQPGRLRHCHRFLPDGPAPVRNAGPGPRPGAHLPE